MDLDALTTEFTLVVMHHLMYSWYPGAAELAKTNPILLCPFSMASMRGTGEYFVAQFRTMEARRLAAYAEGLAPVKGPQDLLDLMLADLDSPTGAYKGNR